MRDTITRRNLIIASALSLTLFASSQAGAQSWDEVVKAANEEGQMLLYSTRADRDNAALIEAFNKKYPDIQVQSVRLVGGAMIARVDEEMKAGALAGDVLLHAEFQWADEQAKKGNLVKPEGPSVPLWEGSARPIDDNYVVVTAEPWVIGWNTNLVKTEPTDWDSLLGDTSFAGRVGLNEVSGLTVAIWYDFIEQKKPGYWDTFAALKPRIYPNSAPLTAGLSSGEIAWAPYSLPSSIRPLAANGAPIKWVVPSSGTWALERAAMILKDAPHPNAARVFLDFMMSQEGQQELNGDGKGFSFAPGAKVEGGLDVDINKIAKIDYTAMPPDLLKRWQVRVDQLLRQ